MNLYRGLLVVHCSSHAESNRTKCLRESVSVVTAPVRLENRNFAYIQNTDGLCRHSCFVATSRFLLYLWKPPCSGVERGRLRLTPQTYQNMFCSNLVVAMIDVFGSRMMMPGRSLLLLMVMSSFPSSGTVLYLNRPQRTGRVIGLIKGGYPRGW